MDDVEDFGIKEMKAFPGDWRLPHNISGFSSCQVKRKTIMPFKYISILLLSTIAGVIAICGGNTGQAISNKFYMIAYKSVKNYSHKID